MITLTLPFPPAGLSPNRIRREHWSLRSELSKAYREECRLLTRQRLLQLGETKQTLPLKEPVRARITFVIKDNRRRDMDNLFAAFKPAIDGMVDAGVLRDDDIWSVSYQLSATKGLSAVVLVALEESL